jgi:hypothetical protein
MRSYFWHGLSQFPGSIAPDGWAYIAAGQYLWEYPRGAEGGLGLLHQFGSYFAVTRYISFSLLGFFSPLVRAGDTQMVASLFQAWGLFVMTAAVAGFWVSLQEPRGVVVVGTVLSTVAGWISNLLWANNFDNGLALVYLPLFAAMFNLFNARQRRWWAVLGAVLAALVYTYPELAPFLVAGVGLLGLSRFNREWLLWKDWLQGFGIVTAVSTVFLLPVASLLWTFVVNQFQFTLETTRPGEGLFEGLVHGAFQPAAFWGLGAEHRLESWNWARQALGVGLSAVGLLGIVVLIKDKKWGLAALTGFLTLGAIYLILEQHYSYGAYKLIVLAWWGLVVALVKGGHWIITSVHRPMFRYGLGLVAALGALLMVMESKHTDWATTEQYLTSPNHARPMSDYRLLMGARRLTGGKPLLLAVDDWLAYEWAVYFLRDQPIYPLHYRGYLEMPKIENVIRRAVWPTLEDDCYVLTDASPAAVVRRSPDWDLVWEKGPYRLWHHPRAGFALLQEIRNANGLEQLHSRPFFWMGQGDSSLTVLATREGVAELEATFLPGPSVPDSDDRCLAVITRAGGETTVTIPAGLHRLLVPVKAGRNTIVLRCLDRPDGKPQANGDTRPLVVGVLDLRVNLLKKGTLDSVVPGPGIVLDAAQEKGNDPSGRNQEAALQVP